MYKLETPNKLYNGVTEGVPFSNGIGQTDDNNIRNVLVNDYGYKDITEYSAVEEPAKEIAKSQKELSEATESVEGFDLENLTVPQLKEVAKDLNLSNYSKLTRNELIELITNTEKDNA